MLELVTELALPGALVGFVLAAWKGARGAMASFVVGTAIMFVWSMAGAFSLHQLPDATFVWVPLAMSIPWWWGAFLGASLGISARAFRRWIVQRRMRSIAPAA
jgi:hypothetical protein